MRVGLFSLAHDQWDFRNTAFLAESKMFVHRIKLAGSAQIVFFYRPFLIIGMVTKRCMSELCTTAFSVTTL
jgi:hypothetical protein